MTQEQKELLLKDLCTRLPYGVKCLHKNVGIYSLTGIDLENYNYIFIKHNSGLKISEPEIKNIKPYLFPLSSMTEEQKKYITDRWGINEDFDFEIDPNWGKYFIELGDVVGFINWCYENHLDIDDLILQGLAIDATGLNIY